MAAKQPAAIILSGGPQSVYAAGCSSGGSRAVRARHPRVRHLLRLPGDGGGPGRAGGPHRPVGVRPDAHVVNHRGVLLDNLPESFSCWMSHGDLVTDAPAGFTTLAHTAATPVAAFEDTGRRLAGVQWHPEVLHTEHGQQMLAQFLYDVAGLVPDWTPANIVEESVAAIREQVGDKQVLCALSGGVDSAVAAAWCTGDRRPAHLRLRRPRPAAQERARAGQGRLRRHHRHQAGRRRRRGAVPERARRGQRAGDQAQDHRP
jgi:GMP synthase (glutamine-hydrolysing)